MANKSDYYYESMEIDNVINISETALLEEIVPVDVVTPNICDPVDTNSVTSVSVEVSSLNTLGTTTVTTHNIDNDYDYQDTFDTSGAMDENIDLVLGSVNEAKTIENLNAQKSSVKFISCTSNESDDASSISSNNKEEKSLSQPPCAEDFVLLKPISKGAFGKVWLGFKKTNLNRMYAIKVMKKADLINKNLMAQVITERDAQARSQSAFVVQLYYSIQSRQNIFLIMEYMIGGDVKSLLIIYGFFSEEMSCFYAAEVTLALAYLHKLGIVHRDLKPDNMLISNTGHLKLTDFGLSKVTMDYRSSPQPGCFTPFSHRYGDFVDLRTPGQILSLKSSLTFTVDKKCNKTSHVQNEVHQNVQETTPTQDLNLKTLPSEFRTPQEKTHKQSLGRCLLTPADNKQIQARRLHSSVLCTPPVKSLTPTLQDSLNWRNSSASDSQSVIACSILQSALLSRVKGMDDLSAISDGGNFKEQDSNHQPDVTYDIDMSGNGNNDPNFNKEGTSFLADCGDIQEECKINDEVMFRNLSSKKFQNQLNCDSHILPIFRLEGEDETPLLHRTDNSVRGSYAAKNLRLMREGSYCEDNPHDSFCTYGNVNSFREDVINLNCNDNVCLPIHGDTPEAIHPSDISMLETHSILTEVQMHSPSDYSEPNGVKQSCGDIFLSNDSNAFSNTSVEVARGIVSSFDESLGVTHNKSRHVSVAGSADLEFSSDFSAHLHQRDRIFNSTRLSLDFGSAQMSLDSGPELKDLSQLSGLSRVVLKALPPEDNTALPIPSFNVVPSKKSESLIRKQNDLAPSTGPLIRKLSKPGLRRVLSDTFDRCVSYSSSHLDSSSQKNKNTMKHKSKSLDYGNFFEEQGAGTVTDSNKFQRKRSFHIIDNDSSGEVVKKTEDVAAAHTGMTPDFCRMRMRDDDGVRPRKQSCLDRNFIVHNCSGTASNGEKQVIASSNKSAFADKISDKRICKSNKAANPPVSSPLRLRQKLSGSPGKPMSINSPPHHPKVAYLRESKSSHVACSGLTDEVNGQGLRDIVHHKQTNFQATNSKVKDVKNDTYVVEQTSEEEKKFEPAEEYFSDCSDIVYSRHPLHRVPASKNISSLNDSTSYKLQSMEDCTEDFTEENEVKFFIATPSPGSTMHSSPAPRNACLSPLIIKKGVSTLDSSIGTDSSFLNVTIEYEGEGAQSERLSPLPVPCRRLSRSFSESSMSDIGRTESDTERTEAGVKLTDKDLNKFESNQSALHPLSSLASRAFSALDKQRHVSLTHDESQQKQLVTDGENITDMIVDKQQKMFSTIKKMPSIAEGVNSLHEEENKTVFVKPWNFVDTGLMHTPNPQKRDALFQNPFCTPRLQHQTQTPVCGTGVRLQTPLRTPKSVRRGPELTQDEGRILGTPDYLAPEILLQKPHGFAVDWWALGVCLYEFLTGLPPFNDQTPEAVFENILKRDITWPEEEEALSVESKAAIEALLTVDVDKRPTAKDVKAMSFFASVDWTNLLNVEAPFIPHPEDNMDTTYFEPKNAVRNLVLSDVSM